MAPKKADPKKAAEPKKEEKKKVESPEMKELREKEKALVRVPQPDRAELDAALEKINEVINNHQTTLKGINEKISAKSTGKDEHFKARDEIKAKLDEYTASIDALEKKKKSLQDGISDKQKEGRQKRQELNDMKKKLGFESEADIDAEIKKMETAMYTQSLSLAKEKEMMKKMAELRKSKPMVTKYNEMEGETGDGAVGGMKDSIEGIKTELNELRDAKKLQSQAYAKLMEARQKVMGDVPKLFEEREVINGMIREKITERNTMRDAFNVKNREFSAYMNEARALRNERAKLERASRQAEWEERQKSELPDEGPKALPFADDLQYLENMMAYLKSNLPKEAVKAEEEKAAEIAPIAGNMVLKMKSEREEEFFFAPTKQKQLKKKGGGKAKPIVHSMETLGFFDKYKVSPPPDANAVPEAITAVEAKVAEFKAKQEKAVADAKKAAEEKKEEKPAGEEPAEAEAVAA